MDNIPIIPGLVRDNSIVLLEQLGGLGRYRMSMVDKGWNAYCESKIIYLFDTKEKLERVVRNTDILSIIRYADRTKDDKIMQIAFKYGNRELIDVLSRHEAFVDNMLGGYFDWGLDGACQSGDMELVQLAIEKGASFWEWGLRGACEGNNVAIAQMMIDRGARNYTWGLHYACYGGSAEAAQLMIEKGADTWNYGLMGACGGDSVKLAQMMIEKGARDWNQGLLEACISGSDATAQLMITNGATDWNGGLTIACGNKQSKMVQLMIEKGATRCSTCIKSMSAHLEKN